MPNFSKDKIGGGLMYGPRIKIINILILILLLVVIGTEIYLYKSTLIVNESSQPDPYHVKQYAEANKTVNTNVQKVVMVGDSIVYRWKISEMIDNYMVINRGIGSETTDALVGRFNSDVINLYPKYVIILSGINDLGFMYIADPKNMDLQTQKIASNILLMGRYASGKDIKPIICSVLPVSAKYFLPAEDINPVVKNLNKKIESMAISEDITYIDFWPAIVDQNTGMLKDDYVIEDGIHPNDKAYQAMWKVLEPEFK